MRLSDKIKDKKFKAVALWVWLMMLLLLPNGCLMFTERVPAAHWAAAIGALAFFLVPAAAYLWLSTLCRNVGKSVWLTFPLIFLSAFQIVLLDLFGRSVIAVDMWLNLVTTNASEAGELLACMVFAITFVVVAYIPPLVMSVFAWRGRWLLPDHVVRGARAVAAVVGSVGLVLLAVVLATQPRVKIFNDMYPVNVVYNAGLAVERVTQTESYHSTSESYSFGAIGTRSDSIPETYVLVIGETARSDHFGLFGYEKNTTPRLSARKGIVGYRNTLSESNTTHKSVPMLLSHIDARTFGDSIYRVKGLAEAFREAGFRTAFFSNQQRNGSFIDFFGQQADTCVFLRDHFNGNAAEAPMDMELLPLVEQELRDTAPKKLIILHTYGSHFRYDDRYPEEYAAFDVGGELEVSPGNRERLVAAYDNTINYTDAFLDRLIGCLDSISPQNIAGLIYTSDHGEDIYDDDTRQFLHASPLPSIHQVSVPFILWLSDGYAANYPETATAAAANSEAAVSSTRSVFHSLLHMAGISARQLDTTQSVLSHSYTEPTPRLYLDDHNRPMPLSEMLR